MPTITNHFTSVQMLKLSDEPGKSGPLIVVQSGVAPGDMTVKDRMFLLCGDGSWVDVVELGAAGKPELWDQALFDSSAEVMILLDKLGSPVQVRRLDTTPESIQAWLTRTAGLDAKQRIQNLLNVYKERLRNRRPL